MKKRNNPLGDKNRIGANVTQIRIAKGIKQKYVMEQLQTRGIDMNPSSLSKLEGQTRQVTDIEMIAIAEILDVSILQLIPKKE